MKVIIFGNNYKKENLCLLSTLFAVLEKKKAEILMEKDFYDFVITQIDFAIKAKIVDAEKDFSADLAVSIGGDGTFLKTANCVGNKNIPIIGINTGRLGFLADIAQDDIIIPFEKILDNEFIVEERTILQMNCGENTGETCEKMALNEIAIMKQETSSMLSIRVHINKKHTFSYEADGLIISTPTGSTAYSMSLGGPIVVPEAKIIVITPIAPHSLTVRPLVITDDSDIRLEVVSRSNYFLAAADGRSKLFSESNQLWVKKADYTIKVVKQKDNDFFNTLRNKLMWGVDKRMNTSLHYGM